VGEGLLLLTSVSEHATKCITIAYGPKLSRNSFRIRSEYMCSAHLRRADLAAAFQVQAAKVAMSKPSGLIAKAEPKAPEKAPTGAASSSAANPDTSDKRKPNDARNKPASDRQHGPKERPEKRAPRPARDQQPAAHKDNRQRDRQQGGARSTDQRGSEWACNVCTLVNPSRHVMCDACGTARPSQAPAAEQLVRDMGHLHIGAGMLTVPAFVAIVL
jgi:hypothetical protein